MEFRVRAEEGSIWKRFNRNLANVGRGRGGRNSRYARFSVRSRAGEFFTSTRGQHAAVHRRSDFAAPLEIIVETHRGNDVRGISLLPSAHVEYTRVYSHTRRRFIASGGAGRAKWQREEREGPRIVAFLRYVDI